MAIVDWKSMPDRLWSLAIEPAVGKTQPVGDMAMGFLALNMMARMLKPIRATSWITLITIDATVEPDDAAHGDEPDYAREGAGDQHQTARPGWSTPKTLAM